MKKAVEEAKQLYPDLEIVDWKWTNRFDWEKLQKEHIIYIHEEYINHKTEIVDWADALKKFQAMTPTNIYKKNSLDPSAFFLNIKNKIEATTKGFKKLQMIPKKVR